jgi:phosphoglycolate phosphatase-like HAD superfamily hydrolase
MHVVLFDIDGTLISSGGAGRAALLAGLAEEFGPRPLSARLDLSGRTDLAIIHDLLRLAGLEDSPGNVERLRAAYLRQLPAHMRAHTTDVPAGSAYHARVLPGIAGLLEALAGRGDVHVGLLTGNMRAGARIKLGHFGLFDHFAFGGFGDLHHDRNDVARAALGDAARHLNGAVDPRRVWVVGDTPLDVRCARAVGARVLAVVTGWHSRDQLAACAPDLLLDDLSDPSAFLSCWDRPPLP